MRCSYLRVCAIVCCFALAGCKETLYSNLEETEANEMVAVLAAAGIDASRERDKDNIYAILVNSDDVATATTVLGVQGYPRPQFQSLGEVFSAEGIVGTPFERQVRYIHAMNEEMSRTISSIAGVRSARVFIAAPPRDRYAREDPPASASVVINYEPGFDAEAQVSRIKTVIAHSVPNLDYDDVAVALFLSAGTGIQVNAPGTRNADRNNALPEIHEAGFLRSNGSTGSGRSNSGLSLTLLGMLFLALAGLVFTLRSGGGRLFGGRGKR